jgi:hypothetical protein
MGASSAGAAPPPQAANTMLATKSMANKASKRLDIIYLLFQVGNHNFPKIGIILLGRQRQKKCRYHLLL